MRDSDVKIIVSIDKDYADDNIFVLYTAPNENEMWRGNVYIITETLRVSLRSLNVL